jgi:uncharacterized spore protein YtfJ
MATDTTELLKTKPEESANGIKAARKASEGRISDQIIEKMVDRIGGRAGVETAFGQPIERGQTTLVPVARVRWGFGAGSGSAAEEPERATQGGGTGAGGAVGVEPIGYLELKAEGVEFRRIAAPFPSPFFLLAAGFAGMLVLRSVARLIRG